MTLNIRKYNSVIGARLEGIDFGAGLGTAELEAIAEALYTHQLIVLPAAEMTPEQHQQIAFHFGEPEHNDTEYFQRIESAPHITVVDSAAGDRADSWHADETFLTYPPRVNLLHALELPPCGGDTAFISAAAAYEALSERMKYFLEGLTAEHDLAMTYELGWRNGLPLREKVAEVLGEPGRAGSHPMVRTHPVTGRKWLSVNPTYTRFIEDLPPIEGQAVLDMLFRHMQKPEFCYRHQWRVGDLVIWDQQAVQHYAVRNFDEGRRLIHRIAVLPRVEETATTTAAI